MSTAERRVATLAERAIDLLGDSRRVVLGIAGSPGSGKTTLAKNLVAAINATLGSTDAAVYVPMDGYHLANSTLDRLGNHDRKGAIDTFDGWGFLALVNRILVETEHTVYAPSFDRSVDEGIAGEVAIDPSARLVVIEGNYLLVDEAPWGDIRNLLVEAWFCETSAAERLRRLVDRHERHGRDHAAALDWAQNVDGANAVLIEASRARAHLSISGETAEILGA